MNEIDKNKHILDLIIIGLGPAGLTTLVNSSFFSLRLLAFERNLIGGKINEIKKKMIYYFSRITFHPRDSARDSPRDWVNTVSRFCVMIRVILSSGLHNGGTVP